MLDPTSTWGAGNVLTEWAKVNTADSPWRNALASACSVSTPITVRCETTFWFIVRDINMRCLSGLM